MLQLEIQRTGLAYSKQPQFPSNISCNVDKNIRCRKMCSFKTNFDLEAGLEPQQLNLFEKTSIPFKVKLNFHFSNFPLFKFCFKLNIFWTTYLHPLQRKRTFWFGIHFFIQKWSLFSGLWKFENVKHSFCADLPNRAQHKASFGYATIPSSRACLTVSVWFP